MLIGSLNLLIPDEREDCPQFMLKPMGTLITILLETIRCPLMNQTTSYSHSKSRNKTWWSSKCNSNSRTHLKLQLHLTESLVSWTLSSSRILHSRKSITPRTQPTNLNADRWRSSSIFSEVPQVGIFDPAAERNQFNKNKPKFSDAQDLVNLSNPRWRMSSFSDFWSPLNLPFRPNDT